MKNKRNMFHKYSLIALLLCLFITGCGRNVTEIDSSISTNERYSVNENSIDIKEKQLNVASNIEVAESIENIIYNDLNTKIDNDIEIIDSNFVEIEENANIIDDNLSKSTDNVYHDLLASNYNGTPFIEVNNNIPYFTNDELTRLDAFEYYSDLDILGRCGVAFANICNELMPTEKREEIGQVRPSGWHTVKYNDLIDGNYLYNRCHLIGFQLAGENANEKNLITGTRYLNVIGMLPFENKIADYVKDTNNHVLYRVTPIFVNDNLVAEGVLMEAFSVEDNGNGICFNIFCYNVQPNISIDYSNGDSFITAEGRNFENNNVKIITEKEPYCDFILNTNSKKFHNPNCSSISKMSEKNKEIYTGTRSWLENNGYEACGICRP